MSMAMGQILVTERRSGLGRATAFLINCSWGWVPACGFSILRPATPIAPRSYISQQRYACRVAETTLVSGLICDILELHFRQQGKAALFFSLSIEALVSHPWGDPGCGVTRRMERWTTSVPCLGSHASRMTGQLTRRKQRGDNVAILCRYLSTWLFQTPLPQGILRTYALQLLPS